MKAYRRFMLRFLIFFFLSLFGTIKIIKADYHIKNVNSTITHYQKVFKNKTVNLVTTQPSDKNNIFQNEFQLENITNTEYHNYFNNNIEKHKKGYEKKKLLKLKVLIEIGSGKLKYLQNLPFYLDDSYFNTSYMLMQATFNYLKIENKLQVLELPVNLTYGQFTNAKLWILLPNGPSTRNSLTNEIKNLNSQVIDDIKLQLKPERVHVEIPVFHIDSLYDEFIVNQTTLMKVLDVSLNTKDAKRRYFVKKDTIEEDSDVNEWFEANKPFIFIVFSNEGDIILIGHFCNPGSNNQVPKNKLKDIGYW